MPAYTVRFSRQSLILVLEQLELEFSLEDGGLRALRRSGGPDLTGHGVPHPAIDISLAEVGWLTMHSFPRYLSHTLSETPEGVELVIIIGLGPLKIYDRYRIAGLLITRRISIENTSEDELALCGVRMALAGVRVGRPERCRFEAPANVMRPRMPIASLRNDHRRAHWFDSATLERSAFALAPGNAPGLLVLHNDVIGETLACWYEDSSNAARPRVESDGSAVTLLHEIRIAERLRPEVALSVGVQSILVHNAPWQESLALIHGIMGHRQEPVRHAVDWMSDASIFVVHPSQYGGYLPMIGALDDIRRLGCNTICLLPVYDIAAPLDYAETWPAAQPEDLYALRSFSLMDPRLGDVAALAELVRHAHTRGMRMLLDLPVSGCAADSPYVSDHPHWFCRDQGGQVMRFSGIVDTFCFDWRDTEMRAFAIGEILTLLEQTDIDGFRVLIARDLPPGWSPDATLGGGALSVARLIAELHDALRQLRPAAALATDLAGPLLGRHRDLVIDEAAHFMFTQLAVGGLDASEMYTWLADSQIIEGHDMPRACFTESHHSNISNPMAEALRGSRAARLTLAALVCCGFVPMIRAGQESDNPDHIARLLYARARCTALRRGVVEPDGVRCDDPSVLAVLRRYDESLVVGVMNPGPSRRDVVLGLSTADLADGIYILDDLLNIGPGPDEAGQTWRRTDLAAFPVTLEPFSARLLSPRRIDPVS